MNYDGSESIAKKGKTLYEYEAGILLTHCSQKIQSAKILLLPSKCEIIFLYCSPFIYRNIGNLNDWMAPFLFRIFVVAIIFSPTVFPGFRGDNKNKTLCSKYLGYIERICRNYLYQIWLIFLFYPRRFCLEKVNIIGKLYFFPIEDQFKWW